MRNNEVAMEMVEATKERLRELLVCPESEEQTNAESTEFMHSLVADIIDAVEAGELKEEEWPLLIKEIQIQSMIFMEELLATESMGDRDAEEQEVKIL